ncbi:isoleucyl-tRNA synthetase [Raphidocelis subcapitata]|uniref:isoleucine--tRNA ligase n=1 Tax=Raphidocelis subcapitata TaxID=307507 RepID=A0A2V0NVQ7_9CHLO|nr:isoleucyl-tRNA synthetase [Raphidocelis subcapitata]|eukprot:GBF91728.1 isoleucyl-tRNA synthetase [Raphidocelis subcapitata]
MGLGSRLVSGTRLLGGRALAPALGRAQRGLAARVVAKADAGAKGNGKSKGKKDEGGPYSATVKTPVTDFSMRANAVVREPEIQSYWAQRRVYENLAESNPGEPWTLHDGPPYANGDLHIGHALNKILKDVINRYQLLRGRRARFVPGWDTHGLPIELKVLQALPEAERRGLDTLGLRTKARAYALEQVDRQREQFKRYGVWGDWSTPYVTLDPAYEAAQLAVFGKMVLNGHIYRGRKPVHWSPSSRTALAEAELEYPEGHRSRSIYVALPLSEAAAGLPSEARAAVQGAALAIWTTTPWTVPANLAVAVNGNLEYAVVEFKGDKASGWAHRRLVVARELVEPLKAKFGLEGAEVLATFKGAALEGSTYTHPLYGRTSPVVIGGDYITTESGTGLVHTAPGHGQEDYQVGQRYGLPLLSPVDDAGCFTDEAGPAFAGLAVQSEGNAAVITELGGRGALLLEESYEHKYPYDWRTKKPTIFRATDQWFASVEGFRAAALEAIRAVSWVPSVGENRITSMTEGRSDWCISRQRKWGVPIPVFYDKESGAPLLTAETIDHVTSVVASHGSDAWWRMPIEALLPPSLAHLAPTLKKGEDTMDVWFDSGSSWAGVVQAGEAAGLRFPADLYLEGSDQHRGWFQSSLLTAVAATGRAPYRQVLTHGFVLDERGAKMSKSVGNVVDPRAVIEGGKDQKKDPPFGADVLRLWVSSVDYSNDVMIGPGILKQVAESYRKLRGTLRFLLGSLNDFDPAVNAVDFDRLPAVDRYMLGRHAEVMAEVTEAYETYQFRRVYQALLNHASTDLSAFYLDAAKDRLYIQGTDSASRRACQTVCAVVLQGLLSALAPITPHMAEDAWLNLPWPRPSDSVFQSGWSAPGTAAAGAAGAWREGYLRQLPEQERAAWAGVLAVRDAVNSALEKARAAKLIGPGLEAAISVHASDAAVSEALRALAASDNGADDPRYVFIVSEARVAESPEAASEAAGARAEAVATEAAGTVTVGVSRAAGAKCARCWNYSTAVGSADPGHPEVCERCGPILSSVGFKLPGAGAGAAAAAAKGAPVAAA